MALSLIGCGETQTIDSRFSTPEHTVRTLLATHGLQNVAQEEVRARIGERGAFQLQDAETWALCFVDLDQPGGDGLAGYVLGLLAAAHEDLRYELVGESAYVFPREGVRIVMRRLEDSTYRIVLADSVPEEVRRGLVQVEENAQRRRPD